MSIPDQPYVGIDIRPGPGVDRVADVEALPYADGSIGTLIAMNTFEHVPRFWRGFEEVYRVLRPDGAFLISCPFYFHIHDHPSDYWRFSPKALELLLENYPTRRSSAGMDPSNGQPVSGPWLFAKAADRSCANSSSSIARFSAVTRVSRCRGSRRWRYRLGRLAVWPRSVRSLPGPRTLGDRMSNPFAPVTLPESPDRAVAVDGSFRSTEAGMPAPGPIRWPARDGTQEAIDVSVCIANWNCRELLRACLESLFDQSQGVRMETVVVDNASSDGAPEMVEREFPERDPAPQPDQPGLRPRQQPGGAAGTWPVPALFQQRYGRACRHAAPAGRFRRGTPGSRHGRSAAARRPG